VVRNGRLWRDQAALVFDPAPDEDPDEPDDFEPDDVEPEPEDDPEEDEPPEDDAPEDELSLAGVDGFDSPVASPFVSLFDSVEEDELRESVR
jgi:hypothetical protein